MFQCVMFLSEFFYNRLSSVRQFRGCVSLQLHYTGSLKSMDSAKYFQNGLAELIEMWHTANSYLCFTESLFVFYTLTTRYIK
jgi:hypothetical protein